MSKTLEKEGPSICARKTRHTHCHSPTAVATTESTLLDPQLETVREVDKAFFLSMTKIEVKRVNHQFSRRTNDAPSTGRFYEASGGPEKSLVQQGFNSKEKRQASWIAERFPRNSVISQKPLLARALSVWHLQ